MHLCLMPTYLFLGSKCGCGCVIMICDDAFGCTIVHLVSCSAKVVPSVQINVVLVHVHSTMHLIQEDVDV